MDAFIYRWSRFDVNRRLCCVCIEFIAARLRFINVGRNAKIDANGAPIPYTLCTDSRHSYLHGRIPMLVRVCCSVCTLNIRYVYVYILYKYEYWLAENQHDTRTLCVDIIPGLRQPHNAVINREPEMRKAKTCNLAAGRRQYFEWWRLVGLFPVPVNDRRFGFTPKQTDWLTRDERKNNVVDDLFYDAPWFRPSRIF